MSANNYVLIRQYKENKWSVSDKDAETGSGRTIKFFKTLEEAVKFAQEYQESNIVEYGLHFAFLEDKNE